MQDLFPVANCWLNTNWSFGGVSYRPMLNSFHNNLTESRHWKISKSHAGHWKTACGTFSLYPVDLIWQHHASLPYPTSFVSICSVFIIYIQVDCGNNIWDSLTGDLWDGDHRAKWDPVTLVRLFTKMLPWASSITQLLLTQCKLHSINVCHFQFS